MTEKVVLSLVIPVLNEAEVLPLLFKRVLALVASTGEACEAIFVNDGSRDASLGLLLGFASTDSRVRVINLSRNFGPSWRRRRSSCSRLRRCGQELDASSWITGSSPASFRLHGQFQLFWPRIFGSLPIGLINDRLTGDPTR